MGNGAFWKKNGGGEFWIVLLFCINGASSLIYIYIYVLRTFINDVITLRVVMGPQNVICVSFFACDIFLPVIFLVRRLPRAFLKLSRDFIGMSKVKICERNYFKSCHLRIHYFFFKLSNASSCFVKVVKGVIVFSPTTFWKLLRTPKKKVMGKRNTEGGEVIIKAKLGVSISWNTAYIT